MTYPSVFQDIPKENKYFYKTSLTLLLQLLGIGLDPNPATDSELKCIELITEYVFRLVPYARDKNLLLAQ